MGGLQAIVRDGETGYLIPWHCPEPFAQQLELLLGNEGLRRSLAAAGRASIERLSWTAIGERLLELYRALLREESQPFVGSLTRR